ncbi:hypothetical protein Tco_1032885 [Tanacetum coccineum]|uniref:Uncharacterized protein n=1 Tax=Tanacetum coccineum TaxID=301880 RepID=A0ABQ5GDB4_9ASTR
MGGRGGGWGERGGSFQRERAFLFPSPERDVQFQGKRMKLRIVSEKEKVDDTELPLELDCMMVVKEIEDGFLEELERKKFFSTRPWWGESEDDREKKLVMVSEEAWMS